MIWLRRRAVLARTFTLCVLFVTVWCLGCRGFEPLLACAEPMDAQMADETTVLLQSLESPVSVTGLATSSATDDCICGCTSCAGSLAPSIDVPTAPSFAAVDFLSTPAACWAARCSPLVPPPQATA